MEKTERTDRAISVLSVLSVLSVISVFSVPPALAQTSPVIGQVLASDSAPVAGARVLLHRIGRNAQGPIDSTRSGRRGDFRFVVRHDTSALYLISAEHSGIEYFSEPVRTAAGRPDTAIRILVYDTSSAAAVSLEARHLVITRPGEDGSRGVLDLMVLRNGGRLTRVAPDTIHPSWSAPLPRGSVGLDVPEGDFSRNALTRRDDSLLLFAPVAPGDKELTVQYLIPSNRAQVQLAPDASGATLNLLAEESGVRVEGSGVALADTQVIQGRSFRRWTGVGRPGTVLRISLPKSARTPAWLLGVLVGTLALVLLGAGWRLLGRRTAPALPSAGELIDAIAALDARYAGRQGETPAAEWSWYETERARMKAQLATSLAASSGSR